MEWIALKHVLLSHLPVAAGLLLPWALFAAQRPGRGIRPWWTVSRYLGWAGLLGMLSALASGFASADVFGHIPSHRVLPMMLSGSGPEALLLRHVLLGCASLLVGSAANWAMNRPRKDHQSLGALALGLGLAWSVLVFLTGECGFRLAQSRLRVALAAVPIPSSTPVAPRVEVDPESRLPVRALDFASLEPIHLDPVKSPAHGGRWIRAWASPEAAAAYRAGETLPKGALVVLNSMEDRWGRPGPDPGPIYALEVKASGPALTFYWAHIPAEQRRGHGGEPRAYWRGDDAHLEGCRTCHATGMADPAQRSRWRPKRIVPAE